MAFENVFGNIDFQAGNKMQLARQAQFQQMLGQAMGAYQNQQQLDLKKQQIEAQGNEFHLETEAQNEVMRRNMGMPATERGTAALQTMAQTTRDQTFTNPLTGELETRPNPYAKFLPQTQSAPQDITPSYAGMNLGGARQPLPRQLDVANAVPAMTMDDVAAAIGEPMGGKVPGGVVNQRSPGFNIGGTYDAPVNVPPSDFEAPAEFGAAGKKMEVGLQKELSEYAAKKNIDLQTLDAKQKKELAFEMEKAKGQSEVEKEKKKPQEILAIEGAFQEAGNMNATIKDIYESATLFTTGFVGQKTAGIGGTPAFDLAQNLKTIEADAGLSKLIEVKERGGTFGALQEKELDLLINSRAALSQSQSPTQFKENLIKYQKQRNQTMASMAKFFETKYGAIPEGLLEGLDKNIIDPRVDQAKQGAIFKNKDGVQIQLRDGKWQKVQ